jgi:hypothetical protein
MAVLPRSPIIASHREKTNAPGSNLVRRSHGDADLCELLT